MYYVYEWYDIETSEIFYVGKGCGERYKCRKRNRKFNEYIKTHECESRIIKYFDTEEEAFEYEYNKIEELKQIGQCTCNVMKGGHGGTVECWSDEARQYYSEHNVMKREEQRERMSKFNPMKNKEIAMKTNAKKKKPVIIGDKEYESVKEILSVYNIDWDVLYTWCTKGINPYGEKCRYKDSPQVEYKNKRYNIGGCRPVVYQGVRYECVKDFAKEIGIAERTAEKWLKRGFNPQGVACRYENDDRELTFINRYAVRDQNRSRHVFVNGIEYKSCSEASRILNVPKSTLYSYLNGSRTSTEYICKYGNQQPS